MAAHEKILNFNNIPNRIRKSLDESLRGVPMASLTSYDPELLYVECQMCGKPVIWEPGKTTELLLSAGVDMSHLDERCMIIADRCPLCSPDSKEGYTLAVVRLAGLTPEEAVYMTRPGGTA